jgi:hypothetical protein
MTKLPPIQIDMTPVVAAVVGVLSEPYNALLAKLQADGRITDAELMELRQAILEISTLGQLSVGRLNYSQMVEGGR